MSIIETSGVVRAYGKGRDAFTAVRGVDLRIDKGELVAILGVNGAGKTSLVEILEGLASPTSGTVRVLGLDPVADRAAVRAKTGIMLQEAGFAVDLTVTETLSMWAGTLDATRPIDEALALTELTHRAHVRVGSLSGGEQRRLDLAMAILGRPELLFLDEPTTGLDPALRHRTWELVRSMLAEGATVVLTTHYMEEAEQLADRILVMEAGRIISEGTPRSLTSARPSTVSFTDAPGLPDSVLAALPGVLGAPTHDQGRTSLSSRDLADTLPALFALAASRGVHLEAIDTRSASLEDAFMSMTAEPAARLTF